MWPADIFWLNGQDRELEQVSTAYIAVGHPAHITRFKADRF